MDKHPIEDNTREQDYFSLLKLDTNGTPAAAYRRAVQACTGFLPTWAERAKPGRARRNKVAGQPSSRDAQQ
ncbi:hypothetical protein [Candidimonas nitroreducens]|uniref:hypothetical protein n=1 Tax=Candidimonas nitroreducens TaxID=683354 RepID=UPI0011781E02|nr:hypothetical protein [Candidimonas nitroreducens]